MILILSLVSAALLMGIDQIIKFLVVLNFSYQPYAPPSLTVIPGVFGITRVHNTGGAWSFLAEHTWVLIVLSSVASLAILVLLCSQKIKHPLGNWSLVLILAGAAGNLIDRVRLGYVIDMFEVLFFDFPVFNFADICVTIGCVLFCIYVLFFYQKGGKGRLHGDQITTP